MIDFYPDEEKEKHMLKVNIRGTEHIIQACKENRVPFLIYTSSFAVVLRRHQFHHITGDESLPTYSYASDYGYLYGYTKAVAERLTLDATDHILWTNKYGRPLKLMTCALRPLPIYGAGK